MTRNKTPNLASWVKNIRISAMQSSLELANDKDFISFALGLPDCNSFPVDLYNQAIIEILKDSTSLQYAKPLEKLKEQIVALMLLRGVICSTEEIFLTSGAQQGISLLTRLLLNDNAHIIVENYAYPGFIQAVEPFAPTFLTVSTNFHNGINLGEVEKILQSNLSPTVIYVVTDGGNPHATSINSHNRQRLAILSQQYGIPIIEDDPYGFLQYEEKMLQPIKSFNADTVFYIGSFSKILAPSLRVGWLVVPRHLHTPLSILKEGFDINIATFSQRAVSKLLEQDDFITAHIHSINDIYRHKRNIMHQMLLEYFPPSSEINLPSSGIFFWVGLPKKINTSKLWHLALNKYKVTFIAGESFLITQSIENHNFIRLNFSSPSIQQIIVGIKRLAEAIKNCFE